MEGKLFIRDPPQPSSSHTSARQPHFPRKKAFTREDLSDIITGNDSPHRQSHADRFGLSSSMHSLHRISHDDGHSRPPIKRLPSIVINGPCDDKSDSGDRDADALMDKIKMYQDRVGGNVAKKYDL